MAKLFMRKPTSVLLILVWLLSAEASGQVAPSADEGGWFYLVKTEPSDPSKEAEFNAWYDDIDIPDVLAVPSFKRARRAVGQEVPEFPDVRLKEGDGSYAALYDISTTDIDNAIIDLYVAARKMNALGRSTDALRVVEANYYQRVGHHEIRAGQPGSNRYFYIQKIICCNNESASDEYRRWFDSENVSSLADSPGVTRVSIYVLYRIMEELAVGEDEIPHVLAVYEIDADSAGDALAGLQKAIGEFAVTGRSNASYEVRDSILYQQLSDIR